MDTDADTNLAMNHITEKVIGCAFKVHNVLGPGFLEKVYENALVHELRKAGLRADQQPRIAVWYDGVIVGDYFADILVEGTVLLEIKAKRALVDDHVSQSVNYCTATKLPLCLLINFSKRVEVRRIAGPNAIPLQATHPRTPVACMEDSPPLTPEERAHADVDFPD